MVSTRLVCNNERIFQTTCLTIKNYFVLSSIIFTRTFLLWFVIEDLLMHIHINYVPAFCRTRALNIPPFCKQIPRTYIFPTTTIVSNIFCSCARHTFSPVLTEM